MAQVSPAALYSRTLLSNPLSAERFLAAQAITSLHHSSPIAGTSPPSPTPGSPMATRKSHSTGGSPNSSPPPSPMAMRTSPPLQTIVSPQPLHPLPQYPQSAPQLSPIQPSRTSAFVPVASPGQQQQTPMLGQQRVSLSYAVQQQQQQQQQQLLNMAFVANGMPAPFLSSSPPPNMGYSLLQPNSASSLFGFPMQSGSAFGYPGVTSSLPIPMPLASPPPVSNLVPIPNLSSSPPAVNTFSRMSSVDHSPTLGASPALLSVPTKYVQPQFSPFSAAMMDIAETSANSSGSASPPAPVRQCHFCKTKKTPEWRRGPMGPKTLCNACGLRYSKQQQTNSRSLSSNNLLGVASAATPLPITPSSNSIQKTQKSRPRSLSPTSVARASAAAAAASAPAPTTFPQVPNRRSLPPMMIGKGGAPLSPSEASPMSPPSPPAASEYSPSPFGSINKLLNNA